jgi:hypothetical protein
MGSMDPKTLNIIYIEQCGHWASFSLPQWIAFCEKLLGHPDKKVHFVLPCERILKAKPRGLMWDYV